MGGYEGKATIKIEQQRMTQMVDEVAAECRLRNSIAGYGQGNRVAGDEVGIIWHDVLRAASLLILTIEYGNRRNEYRKIHLVSVFSIGNN